MAPTMSIPKPILASAAGAATQGTGAATAWLDTSCQVLLQRLPWLLPPEQCDGLYVNLLAGLLLAVVLGLAGWLARRAWCLLRGPRGSPQDIDTPGGPPSPPSPPEPLPQLRDLLLGLPRWGEPRARRSFVTLALGKGHRALDDIDWNGGARDVAWSVASSCQDYSGAAGSMRSPSAPLCRLLAAIPREFGADPRRDGKIDALRRALGCPSPSSP